MSDQKISQIAISNPGGLALATDEIPIANLLRSGVLNYTVTPPGITQRLMYNANDFGATGDGSTDDTGAINTALATVAAAGGGDLLLTPGVYIISPTVVGGTILNVTGPKVRIRGVRRGTVTFKVKNGSSAYKYVISGVTGSEFTTDLSGLEISGITIDFNIANNSIAGYGTNNYQVGIGVFTGTNISIHDCTFSNGSSVNIITCNGPAMSRVNIYNNLFRDNGDDPAHTVHDVSVIYTSGTEINVVNNVIQSVYAGCPAGITGIEIHNSQHVVTGNQIVDYATGILVTGIAAQDTQNVIVANNNISGAAIGVYLWSTQYSGHTTGYGIDGCIISKNVISLAGLSVYGVVGVEYGIVISPQANELDVNNLIIDGNTISHPLEGSPVTNNTASLCAGWYSLAGKTLSNSRITNNTFINFPMAAVRLTCGVLNVDISGNEFINVGSTLDPAIGTSYKTPILISSTTSVKQILIRNNHFVDSNATTRNIYSIFLFQPGGLVASNVYLLNNVFDITGGNQAAYLGQIACSGAAHMVPFLSGVIRNFLPTETVDNVYAQGSSVVDPATGMIKVPASNGYQWSGAYFVQALSVQNGINVGAGTGALAGEIRAANNANSTTFWTINNPNAGASAEARFEVQSDTCALLMRAVSSAGGNFSALQAVLGFLALKVDTNNPIVLYTNNAERARLTGAGTLLVGKTTVTATDAAGNVEINGTLHDYGLFFPQQHATAGEPAYVEGAIYYNTTLHKMRVGGAAGWETVTSV